MRRLDEIVFWAMSLLAVGVLAYCLTTTVRAWTEPPADPYVPSVEIPADGRTELDDLPDRRCRELVDEIILYNPRLRIQTVEDVADAILTAPSVDDLNHRDLTILSSLESEWALEINHGERNDWGLL